MAHIGALKVIESCGIPIDIIVGTSIGSIIGGLYSIGYTTSELEVITRGTDWMNLIIDTPDYGSHLLSTKKDKESYLLRFAMDKTRILSGTSKGGLIYGKNITALFNHLTEGVPKDIPFAKFPITFACVATDAISKRKYVFTEGNLVTAMRSSMAIPSIFTPVKYKNMGLIDGFVFDNFPVDVARKLGADIVIGVDLVTEVDDEEIANSAIDLMLLIMNLVGNKQYERNIADTDIYIKVDTKGYSAASFNDTAIDSLINRGQEASIRSLDELKDLAKRLNIQPDTAGYYHPRMEGVKYYNTISEISDIKESEEQLLAEAEEEARKEEADSTASRTSFFKRLFNTGTIKIGGRFDNYDYASLQFETDLLFLRRKRTEARLYTRLGNHLMAQLSLARVFNNGGRIEGEYTFEKKGLNTYYEGEKLLDVTDIHNRIQLQYRMIKRNFDYSFGARYDVHNYTSLFLHIKNDNANGGVVSVVYPDMDKYLTYYAKMEFNNLDSQLFPTRGTQLEGKFELIDNNFDSIKGKTPLYIATGYWRTAIPASNKLTIIPRAQARLIFENNNDTPFALTNFVGGLHRGMWTEQQMEMSGVSYLEASDNNAAVIAGLEFQYNIWKNHYIKTSADAGTFCNKFKEAFDGKNFYWGVNLGYHYKSLIGPISLIGMYNSGSRKGAAILNIGYYF